MYAHIQYVVFVALYILGGYIMLITRIFKLFSACIRLGGWIGFVGCFKYLFGAISFDDFGSKSSDCIIGVSYEK